MLSPEVCSTGGGKNGREEGTHRKNGLEVAGSREQPPEKRRTPAVVSCCSHPLGKTPEEGRAPERRSCRCTGSSTVAVCHCYFAGALLLRVGGLQRVGATFKRFVGGRRTT